MPSRASEKATFYTLLHQLSEISDSLAALHEEELDKLRNSILGERANTKRKSEEVQDLADIDIEFASENSANDIIPMETEADPYQREETPVTDDAGRPSMFQDVQLHDSERWTSTDANKMIGRWTQRSNQFDLFHARSTWSRAHDFEELAVIDVMQCLPSRNSNVSLSRQTMSASTLSRSSLSYRALASLHTCSRRVVIHPTSRLRSYWVLGCMALLLYDLAMVPFDLCFEPQGVVFFEAMDLISAVAWTLDIPLSFCTGVYIHDKLEMRPRAIARKYLKSWFVIDLCLVLPEWLAYAFVNFPGRHITLFRLVRWGRLLRLMRVARVLRFAKLKPILRRLAISFHLSKAYVACFHSWVGTTLLVVIMVHLLACFWYAFGNKLDNGWVQANGLKKEELSRLYIVSMRWSVARLHGLEHGEHLSTTWELLLDALLIYLSLLLSSYYIGQVATVCMAGASSSTLNLWKTCIFYSQRYRISPPLQFSVMKILESSHYHCAGDVKRDEAMLLEALPLALQHDLLYEARNGSLMTMVFFSDLNAFNPRSVRHICNEAMHADIAVETEVVFAYADACTKMRVVESGRLRYLLGGEVVHESSDLEALSFVSEAVLWTQWEHTGKAVSLEETVILSVDHAAFAGAILQHKASTMHAVRYAKHFVWNLNLFKDPTDLTSFPDLTISNLDQDLFHGTKEDHFIFITHYKIESGTEASLIRDLLLTLLKADENHPANFLQSPIFIDSEDLVDLVFLKDHIIGSATVVVLLTPGLLTRPWCLIEIVTAIRHSVNVVLVEIQRPGFSYCYPDEEFYAGVLAGNLLDNDAERFLVQEGISLEEVMTAIRQIFLKIALPFSPHKSKTVREAELKDILKRCNLRLKELVQEPEPRNSQHSRT